MKGSGVRVSPSALRKPQVIVSLSVRLDWRQVSKLGPACTEGGDRRRATSPAPAEEWLAETLRAARRGELAVQNATGVFFEETAAEWLRDIEFDRERKPGTVKGYRWILNSQLLPAHA
jgi:hypothetical protein